MEQRRRRRSKPRGEQPTTKKVSFIQLMSWEAEFAKGGREKVEQYGAAFCKDFQIEDSRLEAAPPIVARQIIFGRYVVTDVRYHQNAASAHDDLAELYPVDTCPA